MPWSWRSAGEEVMREVQAPTGLQDILTEACYQMQQWQGARCGSDSLRQPWQIALRVHL